MTDLAQPPAHAALDALWQAINEAPPAREPHLGEALLARGLVDRAALT
jgi:hypothetical protein